MPNLPVFNSPPGSELCCSILAMAKATGFGEILVHDKRTPWFIQTRRAFFSTDGILCTYKITTPLQVQQKFKNVETIAKALWDRRSHQNDETGENGEGELPCFARAFFNILSSLKRG